MSGQASTPLAAVAAVDVSAATARPKRFGFFHWVILMIVAWGVIVAFSFPDNLREYRRYLTEARPRIAFDLAALSQDWREADLRRHFPAVPFDCGPSTPGGQANERLCFADVSGYIAMSAIFLSFFFIDGRLDRVVINMPWWSHQTAFHRMVRRFGRPVTAQFLPEDDLGLYVWRLRNGSALFLNRERSWNPLQWNSLLWSSARACARVGCLTH